jgi:hypothetical protein
MIAYDNNKCNFRKKIFVQENHEVIFREKGETLKIKFYNGNQVEDKIVWGLDEGFLHVFIQILSVIILPSLWIYFDYIRKVREERISLQYHPLLLKLFYVYSRGILARTRTFTHFTSLNV